MEDGTSKKKRIIILILSVFAVVFLAGIGMVFAFRGGDGEEKSPGETLDTDCAAKETVAAVRECIEKVYKTNGEREEVFSLYKEAIAAARNEENYERFAELVATRSEYLVTIRDCTTALQLFEEENLDGIGAKNEATIYTSAVGVSSECGDETEYAKWNARLSNAMLKIEGTYYYEYSD